MASRRARVFLSVEIGRRPVKF